MQAKAELLEERRFLRQKEEDLRKEKLLLRKKEEDLRGEKKSALEIRDA